MRVPDENVMTYCFKLDSADFAAAKVLGQEVVGTFHSHPLGVAEPGQSDIDHAVDDSLMFVFDCLGRVGRLWRIKGGKACSLKFDFLNGNHHT